MNFTNEDYRRQAETWEARARAEHDEVQKWRRRALDAEEKLAAAPPPRSFPPKREYGADEGEPLPADFVLTPAMLSEAEVRYPSLEIREEFEKFRRYYGKGDARRANWLGVWWSWLKRGAERMETAAPATAADEWNPPF